MLFIFHVDSGTMLTLDMSLALESVANLKLHIERMCKIPSDKQVLLISGGECLDPNKAVCSYSAGTDTNPIFLFSKSLIESPVPPQPSVHHGSEGDLRAKFRECSDLPPTLSTVTKRTQLAQEMYETAKEQERICENLVHDQHLQQQGWSAVVANLEDITVEFKKRTEIFEKNFNDYIEERDSYLKFLTHFNDDLVVLQKIPVLASLLELERQNQENDTSKSITSEETTNTSQETESSKEVTLLEWISAADNKSSMDQLYDHCLRGLEQFDIHVFKTLKSNIDAIMLAANRFDMKEVKGLGERLSGLEDLMREAKEYIKTQGKIAQSFVQNHTRATTLKDKSILPDLCITHWEQLEAMYTNHQRLWDIRRRCTNAKEELSKNLYHRLQWVMFVENHILEIDHQLVIYHESLKRLRRHLELLQQIHMAPTTYLTAVAEVVRRRAFSQSFLLWASELACHLLTIHNEEVTRRKEFQSQFEGHFLNSLFPGMDDLPPSFATQAPPLFDISLPKVTLEDLERLKKELPDFTMHLNIPDPSTFSNFFFRRSLVKKDEDKQDEAKAVEETLVQAIGDIAIGSNLDNNLLKATGGELVAVTAHGLPHLKDLDKGCESETDTEEFEKVGQSPLELHFDKQLPLPQARTQDASTSTEDNLQISRSEHEKLKSFLVQMHYLAREATLQLRSELSEIKSHVLSSKSVVEQQYESLGNSWENLMVERDNKEKELVEMVKKELEENLNAFKKIEEVKNEQIERLLLEKNELEAEVLKSCENLNELQETFNKTVEADKKLIEDLQRQLQEKEVEKEKSIKEATDRLNREHKGEIENIRSRFKLMTMERSPSDTSLEKSGDFSSLPNHATLLLQMTENFELDKERAVSEAIQKEKEKWEKIVNEKVSEVESRLEHEKEILLQDLASKIVEEKDKQMEILQEREKNLSLECLKYKNTIQQLTECETESQDSDLLEKISTLQNEKEKLEEELKWFKNEKATDLTASVAVLEGKVDATTSPIRQRESSSKSDISTTKIGKLNIESCRAGDQVLVLWDAIHESFKILQENKHKFFLHSDYLEGLGLEIVDGKPNKMYCTGEVIDKEYCHARKSENRYKVPKGTKFFRVKVKPIALSSTSKDVTQSLYHSRSSAVDTSVMSQSYATVSNIPEIIPEEKLPLHSLPPTPSREHPAIPERDECDRVSPENPVADPVEVAGNLTEDSGIVDSIEQTTASLDDTIIAENKDESENSDRCSENVETQRTYISSTWLETMISRVFSKSIQNE